MGVMQIIACVAALTLCTPALAQERAEPPPGGPEIWDLSTPSPRHWHTGLTCWAQAGEAAFKQRTAYNPTGSDVSCSYDGGQTGGLVTLYATQRPEDESFAAIVANTRAQVGGRYRGARPAFDEQRTIQTSAGPLEIDELVFLVEGEDTQHSTRMRGATGVWHADVAGWTLKLRLTSYDPRGAGALPVLAEALLGRAYAEMQTARACAGAGAAIAPDVQVTDEESNTMRVGATMLVHTAAGALPATPLAARQAGFVCLGDTLVSPAGDALVGVMALPGAARTLPEAADAALLGFGEIRPAAEGAARMVALFDMSINPFGVEGMRTDRGHLVFEIAPGRTDFYGVLAGGEVRRTLAFLARHVFEANAPLISMGVEPAP